jgi:hypothetical protein
MNEHERKVRIDTRCGPERRIRFEPVCRRDADWSVVIEEWTGHHWRTDERWPAERVTVDGMPLSTPQG